MNNLDPLTHNRQLFDSPAVVDKYSQASALSAAELELFERFIADGADILDLGVGTGRTTPYLAGRAGRYIGTDVAPNMIAAAARRHPERVFMVGDASDLSFASDASFDSVVFSYNGLDYVLPLEKRDRCLAEVARVLRPGGSFIFSSHDPRAILRAPNPELRWRRWPVALTQTVRRVVERPRARAFWAGNGTIVDRAAGGLITFSATPSRTVAQLERHGFDVVATLPSRHPRRRLRWGSEWWYYVALI